MIINQQFGKLRGVKIPILYAFKKKKDDEDREVEHLHKMDLSHRKNIKDMSMAILHIKKL